MPKLFSSKQIIDILYRNGFVFISKKGSHAKFVRNDKTVIVPTPKKEIPLGTLRSIIRQSGLNADEFN